MKNKRPILQYKQFSDGDKQFSALAVVGAGVSLDSLAMEIRSLFQDNALFILSDRVAKPFINLYPACRRIIVTVETRHHDYLQGLAGETIYVWQFANASNVPDNFILYTVDLKNVADDPGLNHRRPAGQGSLRLPSPGTVGGVAVALAISMVLNREVRPEQQTALPVHLLGLDFCYPENRSVARMALVHHKHNRFNTQESSNYRGVLQRTAGAFQIGGFLVRTSNEFALARMNIATLIENTANSHPGCLRFIDYSMPGIDSQIVEKRIPMAYCDE